MPRNLVAGLAAVLCCAPALAQQATVPPLRLAVELNGAQASEAGCRITLLATNELGAAVEGATLELALFGPDGGMDRLVSLDLQAMTPGKTKVLQFDLRGSTCSDVSRVLVNDVTACNGEGLTPALCLGALQTTSRIDVAFDL